MISKELPKNLEVEQAVLGIILKNNDSIYEVIGKINEEDFYSTSHRRIFREILKMHKENKRIDPITLANSLGEELKQIGGVSYISELYGGFFPGEPIVHYVDIIKEKSNLRRVIKLADEVLIKAYSDNINSEKIIEEAEESLFQISFTKQDKIISISEAVSNLIDITEENYKNGGGMTGISSGYTELDKHLSGLSKGDLIIIAARPSMGKTAFALNLAESVASRKYIVSIFSLEMSSIQLTQRITAATSRIPLNLIRNGNLNDDQWLNFARCEELLSHQKLFIDDSGGLSINEIRTRCRKIKIKNGLDVVVIDYLGLITGSGENRVQEISAISNALKALAKELDITVIALSQLNRAPDARPDHRPMLSDLRDSGSIEQDADIVLFLYRDEYYNKDSKERGTMECIIGKNRNGSLGNINLAWFPEIQKVANIGI